MKSIKYIFIITLVCITMISSAWKPSGEDKTIILQAVEADASPTLLKQSAGIISGRFTAYGLDSFNIAVSDDKRQIVVTLNDRVDANDLQTLLTVKGSLAFYDTYNTNEIAALLKDNRLMDMVDFVPVGCGYISADKVNAANELISSYGKIERCLFSWANETENSRASLYVLKTDVNGDPIIVRTDIKSVASERADRFMVELNPAGAVKFAEATSLSVGKSIAIVIDGKVIGAPVVRQAITGGKCEISGRFSKNETGIWLALLNNDPLPLSLKIIE